MPQKKEKKLQKAIQGNRNRVVIALLVLTDILTISLAVIFSASIRLLLIPLMGGDINWSLIFTGLFFFVIFNIILAWINGLYPGFGLASVHEMQKLLYVVSLASVFLGVFLFLQQIANAYSRFVFLLTWFLSALFMILGRFYLRNRFSRFSWWGIPMVIVGSQENITPIIKKLFESRRLGFRPVYYYDPEFQSNQPISDVEPVQSKEDLNKFGCRKRDQACHFHRFFGKDLLSQLPLDEGCLPKYFICPETSAFWLLVGSND